MFQQFFQIKNKNKWIIFLFFVGIFGGLIVIQDGHEWGDDFALYISQAHAILTGNADKLASYNTWSMQHSDGVIGPYLYPPGYPYFLATYLRVIPFSWVGLKVFQWIFYALGVFAFYSFLNKKEFQLNFWPIIFLIALVFLHPKYVQFADRLMSDLWFLTTLFTFFYYLYFGQSFGNFRYVLIGFSLILTSITRVNGFLLIGSWWLYLLLEEIQWKNKLKNIGLTLPFVFVVLWFKKIDGQYESNHIDLLNSITIQSIFQNCQLYLSDISTFAFSLLGILLEIFRLNILLGLVLLFLFIKGLTSMKQLILFAPILSWIALNLLLILVWPIGQGTRYLLPILPFIYLIAMVGLQHMIKSKLWLTRISVMLVIVIFIQFLATVYFFGFVQSRNDIVGNTQNDMYRQIKLRVKDNEIIAFDKPRWLHLATDKKVVRKLTTQSFFESEAIYLLKKRVDIYSKREFNISDSRLDSVYGNKDFILYRRNDLSTGKNAIREK